MNYFVTGATGFIGRHLVEELLKRDGTIYALVREGSRGRLDELVERLGPDAGLLRRLLEAHGVLGHGPASYNGEATLHVTSP